jgi:hypothetical protein
LLMLFLFLLLLLLYLCAKPKGLKYGHNYTKTCTVGCILFYRSCCKRQCSARRCPAQCSGRTTRYIGVRGAWVWLSIKP